MPRNKSKRIEQTNRKAIDAGKGKRTLDVVKSQLSSIELEKKAESSQWSNHSTEQLEELIEATTKRKADFASALSELHQHIKNAKQDINKILRNKELSIEDSIDKQFAIIKEDQILEYLMYKPIECIKKERRFIKSEKARISETSFRANFINAETLEDIKKNFPPCVLPLGLDDLAIKKCESVKVTTIESYSNIAIDIGCKYTYLIQKSMRGSVRNSTKLQKEQTFTRITDDLFPTLDRLYKEDPRVQRACDIIERKKGLEEKIKKLEQTLQFLQAARQTFEEIDHTNEGAIREAYRKTLQVLKPHEIDPSAWQILNGAYRKELQALKAHQSLGEDHKPRTLEEFDEKVREKETEMESSKKRYHELIENDDQFVDVVRNDIYKKVQYALDAYIKLPIIGCKLTSFYHLVKENLPYRLSNSLDELEEKSQEALRLLEEEIKELEFLRSQRQHKLSDQPQVVREKPSPAEHLQEALEVSLKESKMKMIDQCQHIVTAYMRRLFEKSHHQSLNAEVIREFAHLNSIEEAVQVGKYLEQKHFLTDKIREDAIAFAVHVKQTFGFPLHHANIDDHLNLIEFDRAKDGSSSPFRFDIDRQGKILKDGRVQRVYLIGLQDPPATANREAQSKPMALLAIQSTETPYPKYGAGTPLPTGGVVDVRTALQTTRDQPNLYKATLAIETLQETHEQKEIDIQTLEPFESETVINPHTRARLYDVTTFIGKVKDKPDQARPDGPQYQETTGAYMVDLERLISAVKQDLGLPGLFRPLQMVMRSLKMQIARQALGDEFPVLEKDWTKNQPSMHLADFRDSTSMNMFAKYLVLAYREELGLVSGKESSSSIPS